MAVSRVFIIYFGLIAFIIQEIGNVDGKKSSGSRTIFGGGRSSRSSRKNTAPFGRYLGSYSGLDWRTAAMAGAIYGGLRYIQLNPNSYAKPPICTNHYDRDPNSTIYGYFICPRDSEAVDAIYCCGPERKEHCCNETEVREYIALHDSSDDLSIGEIVAIVIVDCIIVVAVCFFCTKRKETRIFLQKCFKKDDINNMDATQVPLNGPPLSSNGSQRPMPPSYDTIAAQKPGCDDSNGLPYGPPQPQLPPDFEDNKSGFPPSEIGGISQPNWAPYPPAAGDFSVSNGAPYSLAPYPPASDAPYPPPGASPYPPMDEAPYPSQRVAPHSTFPELPDTKNE